MIEAEDEAAALEAQRFFPLEESVDNNPEALAAIENPIARFEG